MSMEMEERVMEERVMEVVEKRESEGSYVAPLILDAQYFKGLLLYSR
jgi:hypothetical protein